MDLHPLASDKKPTDTVAPTAEAPVAASPFLWKQDGPRLVVGGALLAVAFAWAYWPTLLDLVEAWNRYADYSHGFFVPPLAVFFLWARRDRFPGMAKRWAWPGLVLVGLSIAWRMLGSRVYLDVIDAWSILLWVAGVAWFLGGWPVCRWALPSIGFLVFMVPLPWSVERMLSSPLQRIATKMSCWILQFLGQPAFSAGNTIQLRDFPLEVEQACSGLRIFVGIIALAFAYIILVRRDWWVKGLLLVCVAPIALFANSMRIVITGLLSQYVSGEAAHKFTHDVAGYVMIPFAAGLFALALWYLGSLVREAELVDVGDLMRRNRRRG